MTEHNHEHQNNLQQSSSATSPPVELDAAARSLSEAFRISFVILKVIMIVLIGLFLISGFETIGPDERAIVLRFGKIRGTGEDRILEPRALPYWVFPKPIEEIVKIPVEKKLDLDMRSKDGERLPFWYYQSKEERIAESQGQRRPPRQQTLDAIIDGYCLTRSEKQEDRLVAAAASDYNIVHSKWQLRYQIVDPELFFTNVFVDEEALKPGRIYFDVMKRSITPLLKSLFQQAVVSTMLNYTIDEAIKSEDRIPADVKKLLQRKLDEIKDDENEGICGIKVISVYLTDITWPRQVDQAFLAAHTASEESQKAISRARTEARNTLDKTAGPVAEELFDALTDEDNTLDEQAQELLWSGLSGTAQEEILEAEAYRTRVVANAKANADYFRSLLPEYRRRPELVIQNIYQDVIEEILANVDEKFVIEPTDGEELRILINRDPNIRPKPKKDEDKENIEE